VKKLSGLIIGMLLVSSLLCGVWLVRLSVSDGEVVLYLQPEIINVEPGQIFTVNVSILNVQYLIKWIMGLSWNSSVIELEPASSSAVSEGPFMKSFGLTYFTVQPYSANSGYLCSVSCEFKQPTSASGSGVLFSVRFKAKSRGETAINIINSVLYDRNKQKISHTCKQAFVSSTSTIHDIAVSLEAPSTLVLGNSALVNVTITNKGETDETDVKLDVLINCVSWQTQNLALLGMGKAERFTYSWRPESKGTYNITVYATLKSSETDLANNRDQRIVNVVELVHDIAVSLEVPGEVVKGEVVNIKVYVENVGAYNENNVELAVLINGEVITSKFIDLDVGSKKVFILNWQPDMEGTYNITAYVRTDVLENKKSLFIYVLDREIQQKILVVSCDTGAYFAKGTSLSEIELALKSAGYRYDVWIKSINGRPTLEILENYPVIIWTCGDYSGKALDRDDAVLLEKYLNIGGNILIEGENVAENNPDSYSGLWSTVLHITGYLGPNPAPGLTVLDANHPIVQGLPINLTWAVIPKSPDSVKPSNGAYAVIKYTFTSYKGEEYAAVVVFDGALSGTGSVVYYSFPIFCLIQDQINLLISNSIRWLTQFGVSRMLGKIVHAPKDSVYFIYPDISGENMNINCGITIGCVLYALCQNSQLYGSASTEFWVSEDGKVNLTDIKNGVIGMFGNPNCHKSVKYYENAGLTPIKLGQNSTHYLFINKAGIIIASLPINSVDTGREDMFVIYVFKEGSVEFLVAYGLGYKGEWACVVYIVDVIIKNLTSFNETFYIFKWNDLNGDGVPQSIEVRNIAHG
jgi:archaellum component FlaF (FlaF/FlaG flagellin family)